MSPLRLLTTSLLLFTPVEEVSAWGLPKWVTFWKKNATTPSVLPPQNAPKRLSVLNFTGGTGQSAKDALLQELAGTREVILSDEKADFSLSATSVGGRITAILSNKAGKEVLNRLYAAPGLYENVRVLADDLIMHLTGQPGISSSQIVFVSDQSGEKQVYLSDSEGREVLQLTHQQHGAVSPTLNSDASALAFTSYRSGFPELRWMDLAQGWERTIADTSGCSFGASFSPDGQKLALVMSFIGNPEIFVTDLSTNTAACISDTTGVPASPSWHPNGKQVIFSDDRGDGPHLYIGEVPETNESEAKLLCWRTGYRFSTDPEFSPDGKMVAFTARVNGQLGVVIKGWPEGETQVIQRGGAHHPSWSPNGRRLCYTQNGDLYVHDLVSGQRRAIVTGQGRVSEPRWMK